MVTVSFSLTVVVTVINTVSLPPDPFEMGIIVNPSLADPGPPSVTVEISGPGVGSGCCGEGREAAGVGNGVCGFGSVTVT